MDATDEGTEDVDGAETIHISGTASTKRLLADLAQAASGIGLDGTGIEGSQESFDEATIDVFTGSDDQVLRRLELSLAWTGEREGGEPFQGAVDVSLSFAQINEEQQVAAPEESRPIRELAGPLPFELSGLGELLSGGPPDAGSDRGFRPSGAEPSGASPGSLPSVRRRCPRRARSALPIGERAARKAERVVLRREDPGHEPVAWAAPAPAAGARGGSVRLLCGPRIAERTMVVFVRRRAFDRGPNRSASLGQGVFFVSRFPEGLRIWYSPHP